MACKNATKTSQHNTESFDKYSTLVARRMTIFLQEQLRNVRDGMTKRGRPFGSCTEMVGVDGVVTRDLIGVRSSSDRTSSLVDGQQQF